MSYPNDQETFRRVINQDLPEVPGDTLDETDQNKMGDFLERLQSVLGYGIGMGFSKMKEFFDDIVSKFAAMKKIEVIKLYQGGGDGLKNDGDFKEFRYNLNLVSTDIIFFHANMNWRRYENTTAYLQMHIMRINATISPYYKYTGIENQGYLGSVLDFVYTNPPIGTASYALRTYCGAGQAYWGELTFTAIKISL